MKATYTRDEVIDLVDLLDRDGLRILGDVLESEKGAYSLKDINIFIAVIDFRRRCIQAEEIIAAQKQ